MAGLRVLIIDDDIHFLKSLRGVYESQGLEVRTAGCRTDALGIVVDWTPQVVIVDLHLDTYDEGLTVVSDLRALLPEARIVLVSGAATAATGSAARDQGADMVVDKPSSATAYLGFRTPEKIEFPTLDDMKRAHVQRALALTGGNHTHAATALGIARRTLLRYLDDWNLR